MAWLIFSVLIFADITVDETLREVSFQATLYPSHFNQGGGTHNHHLIVWKGGKAADNALIQAHASDRDILEALEHLGAVAGNNISPQAWFQRNNAEHKAPNEVVRGSRLTVLVSWPGAGPKQAEDLLDDLGGRGFEFHFGGHEAQMLLWRSGCVVCLQSCPGARISNARYTMRDLALEKSTFRTKTELPPDGSLVTITLRLVAD